MTEATDILSRATDALLKLAADRPWREISLRDIAREAGLPLADLYAQAASKLAVLAALSGAMDQAALATGADSEDVHDRLFDATMARVEAMQPHRAALIAMARGLADERGQSALLAHLPRTARAILEGAGLDATPPRRLAMTALWMRVVQVWRDDEGALNRTMAEIDKDLRVMRRRLGWIGAGF